MDKTHEEPNSKKKEREEVKVKYRGVRPRSGKFAAAIADPKKRATVWLGTFVSAIEAAKAYDKAAFEMRGSKATLNFPHELGISPAESNAATKIEANTVVRSGRKRTKDMRETMAVVFNNTEEKQNVEDNGPIDAVKIHNGPSPSSPPPAHGSGRSISRQSPPMGSSNDKRGYYKWTDESLVAMCNILKKHLTGSTGPNHQFKWADIQLEVEKVCHHKFNTLTALRSKYDAMTKKYYLWKLLTKDEICLGWNGSKEELDCSDDWWEKKIKENPEFKKIWKRQPSKELQDAWEQLFENADCVVPSIDLNKSKHEPQVNLENVVANGVDCVAPFVDPKKSKQEPQVNLENVVAIDVDCVAPSVDPKKSKQDPKVKFENAAAVDPKMSKQDSKVNLENVVAVDPKKSKQDIQLNLENEDVGDDGSLDVSVQHTLHSSQFGNMETEEVTSFSNFINEARQEDRGDESFKRSQKMVKMSTEPVLMKSNTRDSERARMLKELMTRQNATQQSALKVTKTSGVNQVGDSSISTSISVINRMVDEGLMTSCSELWCFAVNLFEDDVKRELFMSLPDDVGRLAWLQYKQNLGN